MTQDKPDCKDFILAVIRRIRRKPTNLKPGTEAGTGLHLVWKFASTVYCEADFRQSLQSLFDSEIMIAVSDIERIPSGRSSVAERDEIIKIIPPNMNLSGSWRADADGNTIHRSLDDYSKARDFDSVYIRRITLYIVADGLPNRVAKLLGSRRGNYAILAQSIIDGMQKEA